MKSLRWVLLGTAAIAFAGAAQAADLPTKKAAPEAAKVNCFDSFSTWLHASAADCPLTWNGLNHSM